MDIEKFLKLGTEYFSDYFSVFISTLRSPTLRFQPLSKFTDSEKLVIPDNLKSYVGAELNPKLFGFMIISIFIGLILNSVVFGQESTEILIRDTIIIIVMWFLYSISIFGLCKILRGQGNFTDTISVSLQLLAVIFVISNLILLLWGMIIFPILYPIIEIKYLYLLVNNPTLFYYAVQAMLMIIYLPIALKSIHNFNWFQMLFTLIVPLSFAFFSISSYLGTINNKINFIQESPDVYYVTTPSSVPTLTATTTPIP